MKNNISLIFSSIALAASIYSIQTPESSEPKPISAVEIISKNEANERNRTTENLPRPKEFYSCGQNCKGPGYS